MANFPITRKPSPQYFSQSISRPQLKSPFENGAVQSRPRATSSKILFSTGWDAITETEFQALVTFFDTYQGDTFNWTHPTTTTVYVVRFVDDRLPEAQYVGQLESEDAWSLGPIPLEEA
jgi:hypothetical protein